MKKLIETLRQEPAGTLRTRLLALLCINAAMTLTACAAAGALHFKLFNAVVALIAATSAVASLPVTRRLLHTTGTREPSPQTQQPQTENPSLRRAKRILILAMAAGCIAYFGGRSTFAIFTAETGNNGGSMSSGTLVLGDKVGTGSTCYSYSGATMDNVNNGCTQLLTQSDMAPGVMVPAAQAKLTVENDGSLDAGTFYLNAPWPKTTLSTPLSSGVAPTQLVLASPVNVPLAPGDQLTISFGGHSQTYAVGTGGATATATTIPLAAGSAAANFSYGSGSRVEDISGDAGATTLDCYDQKTQNLNWPTSGSAPGSVLPFVSTAGNPLCNAVLFWVQEQTAGVNYCWYGRGAVGSPAVATNGQCRTPTTATLSSTLTAGSPITSITLGAPLKGNVQANDSFTISEAGNTDTFTASADAYIGATTLAINPWSPSFAYTTAATIKDTTAFDALNGDSFDTIANFDTGHKPTAPLQLYPLTTNATAPSSTSTISLGKYGSAGTAGYQRTFYIGVYLPAPSGQAQNQLQGLLSTFGLTWHIEQ